MSDADPPGRRERKRQQTLDHLAITGFRLFEEQGYGTVTMEQIAAAADVAKGTLYNHFPVKEALLAHLFHRELADGITRFQAEILAEPTFAGRVARLLATSAGWSEAHRTYLPHYLRYRFTSTGFGEDGRPDTSRSGLGPVFEGLVRYGQEAGELRTDMTAAHLALMLQYLYLGAMMRWLSMPGADLRREFDAMLDFFLRGAAAPATGTPT